MIAGIKELSGNCPNSAPSSPSYPSGVSIGDTREAHTTRIPLRGSKCNLVLFIRKKKKINTDENLLKSTFCMIQFLSLGIFFKTIALLICTVFFATLIISFLISSFRIFDFVF